MPFFAFVSNHITVSHLSKLIGEFSKIVPTLTLNCFLQALHFQILRVARNDVSVCWHFGQTGFPSAQRSEATKLIQVVSSEKNLVAFCNVVGNSLLLNIIKSLLEAISKIILRSLYPLRFEFSGILLTAKSAEATRRTRRIIFEIACKLNKVSQLYYYQT